MLVDVWLKQVKSEQVICIGHRLFFSKFTSFIVNCRAVSDSTVMYFLQYVYFYYSLYYIGSSIPRLHVLIADTWQLEILATTLAY